MKNANLSVAIIYTMFYLYALLSSVSKSDWTVVWGLVFVFPPVILNWLSWHEASKKKQ